MNALHTIPQAKAQDMVHLLTVLGDQFEADHNPAWWPIAQAAMTLEGLRQCIEALRGGWATTDHFNVLADCRDMLSLAAAEKRDDAVQAVCDVGFVALDNMKVRYAKLKRIGASGEELQALMALVDVSEDFWKRQSGGLFVDADKAMCKARDGYREGAR